MSGPNFRNSNSNFPGGFANGVTIRGIPVLNSYSGETFWVDSVNGSDGNKGTFDRPYATLAHAVVNAPITHSGAVFLVKSGHTETISSATAMTLKNTSLAAAVTAGNAVAGFSIVGLGSGLKRPTFTLDTANTATIVASQDGVSIQNCRFVANFLNIATLFDVTTAKGFTVDGCDIVDTSAILNFLNLFKTNSTANAADGLTITNNKINLLATSGVVNLLAPGAAEDSVTIAGNSYISQTTNAAAVMPFGAHAMTNTYILDNYWNLQNATTTATGYLVTGTGACTGFIDGNIDFALPTTPLPVTASMGWGFGFNYHSDAADHSPYLLPIADS